VPESEKCCFHFLLVVYQFKHDSGVLVPSAKDRKNSKCGQQVWFIGLVGCEVNDLNGCRNVGVHAVNAATGASEI